MIEEQYIAESNRVQLPIRRYLLSIGYKKMGRKLKDIAGAVRHSFMLFRNIQNNHEVLAKFAEANKSALEPFMVSAPRPEKTKKKKRTSFQSFTAFYLSTPWRKLRYEALKIHGAKCQCCGGTPQSTGKPMHVDHIQPRSKRPDLELDLSNLQILCEDCNMGKGGKDMTDWRQ